MGDSFHPMKQVFNSKAVNNYLSVSIQNNLLNKTSLLQSIHNQQLKNILIKKMDVDN